MTAQPETQSTFTSGEAYALVNDAVARETAAANEKVAGLETEKSALQSQIDVLETEKAQAIQRAEAAEKALADDKAEREAAAEREAKRDERIKQVAEANPLLPLKKEDGTDHDRVARIVAMDDESFTNYLADMREVASKAPAKDAPKVGELPRESAAFGGDSGADPSSDTASVKGVIGARRALSNA